MKTTGWRKYLPVNSTQADFTALTADVANGVRVDHTNQGGELYINYAAALTAAGGPNLRVVQMGNYRGARIQIFGEGSANQAPLYRLWTVSPHFASTAHLSAPNLSDILAVETECYATGTATLGAATGATGALVSASELFADTLTFTLTSSASTPTGPGEDMKTAYSLGTPSAYSPANDSIATIIIPDFGNVWGWLIEFDRVSNTNTNCIYKLTY